MSEVSNTQLSVSEIFYSLQGEGARAGTANVFVRLQGCKTKHACLASGVVCDTEFESGRPLSLQEITDWCEHNAPDCNNIIWTGGEPADQLSSEIIQYFREYGFYQAIETCVVSVLSEHGITSVVTEQETIAVSVDVANKVIIVLQKQGVL